MSNEEGVSQLTRLKSMLIADYGFTAEELCYLTLEDVLEIYLAATDSDAPDDAAKPATVSANTGLPMATSIEAPSAMAPPQTDQLLPSRPAQASLGETNPTTDAAPGLSGTPVLAHGNELSQQNGHTWESQTDKPPDGAPAMSGTSGIIDRSSDPASPEPSKAPEDRKKRRNLVIAAGVAVALTVAIALVVFLPVDREDTTNQDTAMDSPSRTRSQVSVPSVVGMSLTRAASTVGQAGLELTASFIGTTRAAPVPVSDYPNWVVIVQTPQAGMELDRGSTMRVDVRRTGPSTTPNPAATTPPTATTPRSYTTTELTALVAKPCSVPGQTLPPPTDIPPYTPFGEPDVSHGLYCLASTPPTPPRWIEIAVSQTMCSSSSTTRFPVTAEGVPLTCIDGVWFAEGEPATVLYSQTYTVGRGQGQAPAGTYELLNVTDCYWERLDSAGNIIDNNFILGAPRAEFTIRESDYAINIEGCGGWTLVP